MKSKFMRRLSILLVLAMVLAMMPLSVFAETPTTLYLQPNSNWTQSNARFAAYFYNDSGNTWVDMADSDSDGIYEVAVPDGYSTVIFCRMNPGTTENNWNNKWNQTGDLAIPTDGTNLCSINAGQWDCGTNVTWDVYTPGDEVPEITEAPRTYAYYVAGTMNSWSECNDDYGMLPDSNNVYTMTMELEAGDYSLKVTDGTWTNAWGGDGADGNYEFTVETACTVTVTFDPATSVVTVTGDGLAVEEEPEPVENTYSVAGTLVGSWDAASAVAMTKNEDGTYSVTIADVAAADLYSVKVLENGTWDVSYGGSGLDGNVDFSVSAASSVTVTFDPATSTVSVTGDNVGNPVYSAYYVIGGDSDNEQADWLGNWDIENNSVAMTKNESGAFTATFENVAGGDYALKVALAQKWDTITYGAATESGNYEFTVYNELANVTVYFFPSTQTIMVDEQKVEVEEEAAELVLGDNTEVALGTYTFTAETTGTMTVSITSVLGYDDYTSSWVEANARMINLYVDGNTMWMPTYTMEVTAGQEVTIELASTYMSAAKLTVNIDVVEPWPLVELQLNGGASADDASVTLRMISGLDSLEYASVGFDVTINGSTVNLSSKTVYEAIVADGTTYTAAEIFGEGTVYASTCTLTLSSAYYSYEITITAKITTLDGEVIEGETRTLTLADVLPEA